MLFSTVGKIRLAGYILLILLDVAVLALAARVNIFQEFFFMADVFPFVLSIVTLTILPVMLLLDLAFTNVITARPPFEIGIMYILSVFWLAFNAFSTVRWRFIPLKCSSIPSEYSDERVWCQDVQALKSLVWILFLALFFTASFTLRYAYLQHRKGNRHVWTVPLSRFNPHARANPVFTSAIDRTTITDYFGTQPAPVQPWEKF